MKEDRLFRVSYWTPVVNREIYGKVCRLQMEVTDEESIKRGVQVVTEKEGKLDILISK